MDDLVLSVSGSPNHARRQAKLNVVVIALVIPLTVLAFTLSLLQSLLLWNRDGYPAAFIIWIIGWSVLASFLFKVRRSLSRCLNDATTASSRPK